VVNPPLNELLKKADCKYTLVSIAAKRAREIIDGAPVLVDCSSQKAVTIALMEVAKDKVSYIQTKAGIK
jgi:DNA-directed RNA polymerase subunit omega